MDSFFCVCVRERERERVYLLREVGGLYCALSYLSHCGLAITVANVGVRILSSRLLDKGVTREEALLRSTTNKTC